MKARFEWTTDEEAWESLPPDPPPAPKRRWGWRTLLLLAAMLLAAGFGLYRQAANRVEVATAEATADLISSYNLQQKAINTADAELFVTTLSGRDPRWTAAQESLFAAGLLVDRQQLGLFAQAQDTPLDPATLADTAVTVAFNPELNSAVLTVPQPYTLTTQTGDVETVLLTQTAVYRRGSRNWLYAPPERDFWGEWQSLNAQYLTLSAPARDAALAEQLLADLDDAIAQACTRLDSLDCPADLSIQVRLGSDPELLLSLRNNRPFLDEPGQLELPTPTLLGLPTDADSYDAIRNIYSRALLMYTITRVVEWPCCQRASIYQVLLDYQLAKLGYGRWPVSADEYRRMLLVGYDTRELLTAWSRNEFDYIRGEDGWLAYTAVDFLLHHYNRTSAAEMMRNLAVHPTLAEWLFSLSSEEAVNGNGVIGRLEADWLDYAHAQAAALPLPQPLPAQDVLALCSEDGLPGNVTLYRYRWDNERWERELVTPLAFVNSLPAGEGLVVQQLNFNSQQMQNRALLWQDGELTSITQAPLSLSFGQTDPSGRYLLAYTADDPTEFVANPELFDLAGCSSERCASRQVDGVPVWSPTGDSAILLLGGTLESSPLFRVQNRIFIFNVESLAPSGDLVLANRWLLPLSRDPFGYGYSPFWVGRDRFGYLRGVPTLGDQELVLATVPGDDAEVVLTKNDLLDYFDDVQQQPLLLYMRYAVAVPDNPHLLIITAFDRAERDAYVFSYNLRTETLSLRLVLGYDYDHAFEISPDGRYLVVTGTQVLPRSGMLQGITVIHDILTGTTTELLTAPPTFLPTPAHDWTEDGRWLITNVDDRVFGLVAPEFDYQQVLRHDLGQCSAVLWSD